MIKRESSIDNALAINNDRVKAMLDRIFPEIEKRKAVRLNVKWFNSEVKQLKIKCRKYERNG